MLRIRMAWDNVEMLAALNDSPAAYKLWDILPTEAETETWGDSVLMDAEILADQDEDAREVVDPGTICFSVADQSLAIPYGRTPASKNNECRFETPANVIGHIEGDPKMLQSVKEGSKVTIQKIEIEVPGEE